MDRRERERVEGYARRTYATLVTRIVHGGEAIAFLALPPDRRQRLAERIALIDQGLLRPSAHYTREAR